MELAAEPGGRPGQHNEVKPGPYAAVLSARRTVGTLPSDPATARVKVGVRRLSVWYGAKRVLDDVTLAVTDRSVVALIGPSGCGKSTLLPSLNRMNDLNDGYRHSGDALLDGKDMYAPDVDLAALRRRVGMVFHKSNPFPKSVYENVAFGPRVAGLRDAGKLNYVVERCLKQAALWSEVKDRLHASALALSGGQQQRLCIARALATDPEVLLMDEPASALDPKSTNAVEDLIFEMKRDHAIVIVTHNLQQAARVSDATAFFSEGRLLEAGPTDQIFTRPQVRQTEEYVTGRYG